MYTQENILIFEKYVTSFLIEDIEPAFKSKIPNVINTLKREIENNPLMKDPEAFRARAHTLLMKVQGVPDSSKKKFIEHMFTAGFERGEEGKNIPKEDSIALMLKYLNQSVGNYEQAGYMGSPLSRGIMHDPGWNKPPTPEKLAMHYGDVVKYEGPAHPELNRNDDYMIVRKEVHGKIPIFFVRLYDRTKGDIVDPREFEKKIVNPNYLKKVGNNKEHQQLNFDRLGQTHREEALKKHKAAEELRRFMSKSDINKSTRFMR